MPVFVSPDGASGFGTTPAGAGLACSETWVSVRFRFPGKPSWRLGIMSEVGSRTRLSPGASQLPVAWYFDEKLFEQEKKLIFDAGPGYVGHELMVPEVHDYRSAGMERPRPPAGAPARRLLRDVQRLPPPPGHHAAGLGQREEHRLPDPPLDLRRRRRTDRRAALSGQSLPQSRQAESWRTGRGCCSRARARPTPTLPA
jgi:hypothetical protein